MTEEKIKGFKLPGNDTLYSFDDTEIYQRIDDNGKDPCPTTDGLTKDSLQGQLNTTNSKIINIETDCQNLHNSLDETKQTELSLQADQMATNLRVDSLEQDVSDHTSKLDSLVGKAFTWHKLEAATIKVGDPAKGHDNTGVGKGYIYQADYPDLANLAVDSVVLVSPYPGDIQSMQLWCENGVYCDGQYNNKVKTEGWLSFNALNKDLRLEGIHVNVIWGNALNYKK